MKSEEMLKAVVRTFGDVRMVGDASDQVLQTLDRGVVTVALLLAALDGAILPAEHEAFETLVKMCRGGAAQDPRQFLREEFSSVANLMAMGQTDAFSTKERLDYFVDAAHRALPSGFVNGTFADVRRAFVLWVAMGVSDGEFSAIERSALEKLSASYAVVSPSLGRHKRAAGQLGLLEADFLSRAESAVRGLTVAAKRARSETALVELIDSVQVLDPNGRIVQKSAGGMAVKVAMLTVLAMLTGGLVGSPDVDMELVASKTMGGKFYYVKRPVDGTTDEMSSAPKEPTAVADNLPLWWW